MMLFRRRINVAKLARKQHFEGLAHALRYHDWARLRDGSYVDLGVPVRRDAALALAPSYDLRTTPVLVAALEDDSPVVRLAVVQALGQRTDAAAVSALAGALVGANAEGEDQVRDAAFEGLRPHLATAATAVGRALIEREESETLDPAEKALLQRIARVDGQAGQLLVNALIEALEDPRPFASSRAIDALTVLKARSAPALVEAVHDPRRGPKAAIALGRSGDGRALDALVALLGSDDPTIRNEAVETLGDMRDPRAAQALLSAAWHDDYEVRVAAMASLERVGWPVVMVAMAGLLQGATQQLGAGAEWSLASENPTVSTAMKQIGRYREPENSDHLARERADTERRAREQAEEAERRAREQLEAERRAREQAVEAERRAREQAEEAERRARQQVEVERRARDQALEAERYAREQAEEAERRAKEQAAEAERRAKEQAAEALIRAVERAVGSGEGELGAGDVAKLTQPGEHAMPPEHTQHAVSQPGSEQEGATPPWHEWTAELAEAGQDEFKQRGAEPLPTDLESPEPLPADSEPLEPGPADSDPHDPQEAEVVEPERIAEEAPLTAASAPAADAEEIEDAEEEPWVPAVDAAAAVDRRMAPAPEEIVRPPLRSRIWEWLVPPA